MPRRLPETADVSEDRWILSYADFITLLFAFFVVLYAISTVNEEKYSQLSEVLADRFIYTASPVAGEEAFSTDIPDTGFQLVKEPVDSDIEDAAGKQEVAPEGIGALLEPLIRRGAAKLSDNKFWFEIELHSSLLFEPGSAKLSPESDMLLEQLAAVLNKAPSPINVEGFTDNSPISSATFASNWELSAVRAAVVARVLAEFGVKPERLVASGYGEHRPAYSNRSKTGREKNRRVTLVVARDQQVRRLLSAYGGELLTVEAVESLLEAIPEAEVLPPIIEQTETERGGMLYRQAEQGSGHTQQE